MNENSPVLIVEDNPTNRLTLRMMLKHLGFDCEEAYDGAQAIEKLKTNPYDLILLDIRMPKMDGYEVAKFLRNSEESCPNRETPIVAVSAHVRFEDHQRCRESGMDGFLPKPISFNGLKDEVDRFLHA